MIKINLNSASSQEVFDAACVYLHAAKTQSIAPGLPGCSYRGRDGNRCIVGAFMSSFVYRKKYEGGKIGDLLADEHPKGPLHRRGFAKHKILFGRLQTAYDDTNNWNDSGFNRKELQKLADKNNLIYTKG